MGDPSRFARGKDFCSFTGLAPRASETGATDRKGQPMSKAGPVVLRTTLVRAPCRPMCEHGDAPRRRGRPPRSSSQDNRNQALEAQANGSPLNLPWPRLLAG